MEPFTTAAIAIGTVMATKALEKTGEKIGEAVFDRTGKFLTSLKQQSPDTATAIELAPEQPLDYGQAILEVESAVKANSEFAQTVQELAASAQEESNPKLAEIIQEVVNTVKSQQPTVQNLAKLAEKINNLNQAQTINLTQHNNF